MSSKNYNSEDSARRIAEKGHRGFVGGKQAEMWYGIGMLQYQFLVAEGLKHTDRFVDIGCGSLRLGQYVIPFLDKGHYFGLDAEPLLVKAGSEKEINPKIIELKKPKFSFNSNFNFDFFKQFDVAVAQSVFTHLTMPDIEKCLRKLRKKAHVKSKFYFTFVEGDSKKNEYQESHANQWWEYSRSELEIVCAENGWNASYLGDWGHPRGQKIMLAKPE